MPPSLRNWLRRAIAALCYRRRDCDCGADHVSRKPLIDALSLLAAAIAFCVPPAPAAAAECQTVSEFTEIFLQTYPSGGLTETYEGEVGAEVMQRLHRPGAGPAVSFLYSGDGPVTGKRGRYLYLVHDGGSCVLAKDWIDGETYDWAVSAQ